MPQPGIPNDLVLSTSCYGARLKTIEDQAFAAVAMGFRRLELGLSDSPPLMTGWEDSVRETGIGVDSIVVGALNARSEHMSGSLLGSSDSEQRERALNSSRRHIRLAQAIQAPTVVVRGCAVDGDHLARRAAELEAALDRAPGPDERDEVVELVRTFVHQVQKKGIKQLEHFCRSIHSLRKDFPETRIAVEPGQRFNDLLNFEAMQWTLDDLANQNVGYWHDTGRIHQREQAGLPSQGDWLDAFAGRMFGVHLQDAAEHGEMPPGQGEVDFKLVAEYLPSTASRVLEVNPRHGRAELLAAVQFLVSSGF